ncbi:MAG: DMT family transporter [Gaiellales bacterium]
MSTDPRASLAWLGYLMVAASATFAAANGVFARLVIDAGVAPQELSATRIYGAAIVLIVFLVPHVRKLRRGHLLPLAAFGIIGLVLGQGAYFQAISHADIALVLVIIFTAPLFVAVYERVRLGETLPVHAWVAMAVAVGGVALAILGGSGASAISLAGFLFAVAAMVTYATSVILAAGLTTALPPLARTAVCMLFAVVAWAVIVPPWTLPFDALGATAEFAGRFGFSMPVWVAVAVVVLVGSVGVYVTWVGGTSLVGAGASSMVGIAEPVLAAIFAWALLAQSLSALQAAGIAVTVAGIIVVEQARIRAKRVLVPDVPVDR